MKRILLIILILIGSINWVSAQQEHPSTTLIEVGKVLYLYNKNMRGFLVGGNNYNTQASLSSTYAYKVILEKYVDEEAKWDGKTYYITDSVEMGEFRGSYRKLFIENSGLLYVDQNEQGGTRNRDNLWTIELIEGKDNIYRITPSPNNRNHDFQSKQLGVMALSAQSLPVVGIYDPIGSEIDYEWCFVTGDEKNQYIERQNDIKISARKRIISNNSKKDTIPDEQVVYMYNVDYEGFLIGGNRYNTQASLSKTDAHKVILHKYLADGIEWDGKSYLITDSVRSGSFSGKYRNMFIDSYGMIWTDQRDNNAHLDCIWVIEPSKSNPSTYYIKPSDKNKVFKPKTLPDYYLGAFVHTNFRELPMVSLIKGKDSKYCTWSFVTEEQWKQLELLERREELQNFINIVENRFPVFDTTRAQQVCNDENSSSPEIENQIGQMRLILFSNGDRSMSSVDFSSLIKNADFEGTGGLAWNMPFDVNVGSITWYGGDSINHCAEAYQALFEFYQEIRGIPNGLYRIDLQAFYRTRGADLAWIERDSSFVVPEFYANNMSLPINNLMNITFPTDEGEYDFLQADMLTSSYRIAPKWQCLDGTYALNNMRAAAIAFSKGYFDQSLYCIVDNGTIRIGIREQQKKVGSWSAWDNVRLTYLAETTESYRDAVLCYLEKAKEIERLARIKGINTPFLTEVINQEEKALHNSSVFLSKVLLDINHAIKQTRDALEMQEFDESNPNSIFLYKQIVEGNEDEEERKRREKQDVEKDSIVRILDEANSYFYLGNLILNQNVELALKHFHRAFDLFEGVPLYNSNNIEGCTVNLSMIYEGREQYDDAINVWTMFADLHSKSRQNDYQEKIAKANCEIGHIFNYRKKEFHNAEASYRKATVIIEKLYEDAYKNNLEYTKYQQLLGTYLNDLSYSLLYQKKYEDALVTINRAIELQPNEANYYDSKGEVLYMSGDKEGAKTMWEKVVSLNPNFAKENNSQLHQLIFGK